MTYNNYEPKVEQIARDNPVLLTPSMRCRNQIFVAWNGNNGYLWMFWKVKLNMPHIGLMIWSMRWHLVWSYVLLIRILWLRSPSILSETVDVDCSSCASITDVQIYTNSGNLCLCFVHLINMHDVTTQTEWASFLLSCCATLGAYRSSWIKCWPRKHLEPSCNQCFSNVA